MHTEPRFPRPCHSPRFPLRAPLLLVITAACGGGGGAPADAAPVNPSRSSVTSPTGDVAGNGVDAAEIRVSLRDANGLPVRGRGFTVRASGSENLFLPGARLSSDGDGLAVVQLSTTRAESKVVTVVVDGAPAVELEDELIVEFLPPQTPRKRVSVSSSGEEANDFSRQAAVAGAGRFVAFQSKAFNLVRGDSNQKEDVFVHDLEGGTTERVSLTPSGDQFTDLSGAPSMSDDGNLVAFEGRNSDLDAVYVRDRAKRVTEAISAAAKLGGRCFAPSLSGDGRHVAFLCNDGESQHVWVFDRVASTVALVSKSSEGTPGDDPSHPPSISRDGRFVAFASTADNLVRGDSNDKDDVFVHDRRTGETRRISVNARGGEGNDDSSEASIAANGRFVAFASKAANLVPGDDNGKIDVFAYDLETGAIQRVSVDARGNEVDKESWLPDISADGRYVVFSSLSDDLVANDANGKEDVFRRDLTNGAMVRVSLGLGGTDPNEFSTGAALASDVPLVAFTSKAQNLVRGDGNDKEDVFTAPRD